MFVIHFSFVKKIIYRFFVSGFLQKHCFSRIRGIKCPKSSAQSPLSQQKHIGAAALFFKKKIKKLCFYSNRAIDHHYSPRQLLYVSIFVIFCFHSRPIYICCFLFFSLYIYIYICNLFQFWFLFLQKPSRSSATFHRSSGSLSDSSNCWCLSALPQMLFILILHFVSVQALPRSSTDISTSITTFLVFLLFWFLFLLLLYFGLCFYFHFILVSICYFILICVFCTLNCFVSH